MNKEENNQVRSRYCPSCRTEVTGFILTGEILLPEQIHGPRLLEMNSSNLPSLTTVGHLSINTLIDIIFRTNCPECGHVDYWELSPEEILAVISGQATSTDSGKHVFLHWIYSNNTLEKTRNLLEEDDHVKKAIDALLSAFNREETGGHGD